MKDQEELLRVKTKILERDDEFSLKYSTLLPSKHYVINCQVPEYDLKHPHAGLQTIESILRENNWIFRPNAILKANFLSSQLSKCFQCKRYSAKAYTIPPPPAPPAHPICP